MSSTRQVPESKHETGRDARIPAVFCPRRRQEWREKWKCGRRKFLGIEIQEGLEVVSLSSG